MKILWKPYKLVVTIPGLAQASAPMMRLMVHHSPQMRIEVVEGGRHTLAALVDLDWTHASLVELNVRPLRARSVA